MNSRASRLLVTALVVAGCSDRHEATNQAPPAWSVDPEPVLDVSDSSDAGPPVLESVRFATRLSNGNVVVADQYANALRFFTKQGELLRVVGRKGQGPGEFADVTWVGRCATDSLFVWAQSRRVMIVFDSAGAFSREYRPQGDPQEVTCTGDGLFGVIGMPNAYVAPNASGEMMTAPIWLADSEGDSSMWLGNVPYAENRALGKLTRIAVGEGVLYVGTADSAWVDMYGLNGERRGAVPIGVEPRVPTQEAYALAIERLIAVTSNSAARDMFRATYSALPMPEHLPPYIDLRIDPSGLLWAVISSSTDSETRLRAITPAGSTVAEVVVPRNVIVFEVGSDYILGASKDSTDVDHLVMFHLNRSQ